MLHEHEVFVGYAMVARRLRLRGGASAEGQWSVVRGVRQLLITIAAVVSFAGCVLSEGRAEDTMMIVNTSDKAITVTYDVVADQGQEVIDLDPGERSYVSPRLFGSDRCLRGEFVARSNGEVVDRLPQPCKEQVWEVAEQSELDEFASPTE